jgi:NAD(P)H-flavin reductase
VLGPLGNGFPAPRPGWLVGGGTGIASLSAGARRGAGRAVRLGGRSGADILGLEDFEAGRRPRARERRRPLGRAAVTDLVTRTRARRFRVRSRRHDAPRARARAAGASVS